MTGKDLTGLAVLDLCCGDGIDANNYLSFGAASVHGMDASEKLIEKAQRSYPNVKFRVALAESLPYKDNSFHCVFSKYAIQTSEDMAPILKEIHRVLQPGGTLVYLCTHPLRQWLERKNAGANYFESTVVDSIIFDGTVVIKEPTHTFMEYFNADFFSKFMLQDYHESFDPDSEQIAGGVYPSYFIVKAQKK